MKLLAEMRPNLIAACCDPAKIDKLDDFKKAPTDDVVKVRSDVLLALKGGAAYRSFVRIWTERPKAWWDNMALLGQTDGVEHRILRKNSTALRRAFKASYRVLFPVRVRDTTPHVSAADVLPIGTAEYDTEVDHEPEEADAEARA